MVKYEQETEEFEKADAYFQERFKEYRRFVELSNRLFEAGNKVFNNRGFGRQVRTVKIQGLGMF